MPKQFELEKFGAALVKPADVAKLPPKKILTDVSQMRAWIAAEITRQGVRPFARMCRASIATVHCRKTQPRSITLDELADWSHALGYRLIMSIA